MKSYNNLYSEIISLKNLILAYQKARKGKTKRKYVREFEENLAYNLNVLHEELKNQTYKPEPLKTFILRDPKTRRISKSAFRDRIVHHALCNIIEPIFDSTFIYDSCANRKGKGTLFALNRFNIFQRRVTDNLSKEAFCLKADIKHYFQEVDRDILLGIIKRKIKCSKTIQLIKCILYNFDNSKGMPLGNLTSQFFANVYLNELDYFVKHTLRAKYYIRYVDDFVILHNSKLQLEIWKSDLGRFLREILKIDLHPQKSKIVSLSKGVDFVGFISFYHFRLLRKRNINKFRNKIRIFNNQEIPEGKLKESLDGWMAYAKWANSYNVMKSLLDNLSILSRQYL
jgi:retron-type reverse transcriptase